MRTHSDDQNQEKNTQKHQRYLQIITLLPAFTSSLTLGLSLGTKLYYIVMIFGNAKSVIMTTSILHCLISESNK